MTTRVVSVALLILIAFAGIALFLFYPALMTGQSYPGVVDPAQAYLFSNGTMYLSVYNSWSKSILMSSVQVAFLSSPGEQNLYFVVNHPNSNLGDGSVRILCCTDNGASETEAQSATWTGGGNVSAGGVALLRFRPPLLLTLNKDERYYVAVGSEWFYSTNLEPFVVQETLNDSLPSSVPVRAIVYPNETMRIGVVNTEPIGTSHAARVTFYPLSSPSRPLNASYTATYLGGHWYRLSGGGNLPPYMPLALNGFGQDSVAFVVDGLATAPLSFEAKIVTQVLPIVAPTAAGASSSWSSGEDTQSYSVQWQFPLNGTRTYQMPLTLYGGRYWINATEGIELKVANVTLTSPGTFDTSYYDGNADVTLLSPHNPKGTLNVTLSFGGPSQMASWRVTSSVTNTSSWGLIGLILVGVAFLTISAVMLAIGRRGGKAREGQGAGFHELRRKAASSLERCSVAENPIYTLGFKPVTSPRLSVAAGTKD